MDIVCLQEVHIKKQYGSILEYSKIGKLHLSLAHQKKRGITVYIKEWLKSKQIYSDDDGRILMIEIVTNQKRTLLMVIYVPNNNQKEFYHKLRGKIIETGYENMSSR